MAGPKRDVTYNDDIKPLLVNPKVTAQIDLYYSNMKLTPQSEPIPYTDFVNDPTYTKYNGLKENSDSNPITNLPAPDSINPLTFKDIKNLFTDCDETRMARAMTKVATASKKKKDDILSVLKQKAMPPGVPWPDDKVNMFTAWIYDGCMDDISYMIPVFPSDVKTNESGEPMDPGSLNFNDHILPMFSLGNQKAMLNFASLDLHKYDDVNGIYKSEIFR
ncbi:1086_t:CDS:2, partial [Cetraspora pellucida]